MSNSRLLRQGHVVSMQDTFTTAKSRLGRPKPSTGSRVDIAVLEGALFASVAVTLSSFFVM